MSKNDLLPCPFCGKLETVRMIYIPAEKHELVYHVVCDTVNGGCGASTGWNQETPEDAVNEWNTRASGLIPCSERLPKKDGNYLCISNNEYKILPYRNGEFYCVCFDSVLRCCNSSVTHWMPLPSLSEVTTNSFSASSMSGGSA